MKIVKIVKIGKSRQVLTTGNPDIQANLGKSRLSLLFSENSENSENRQV